MQNLSAFVFKQLVCAGTCTTSCADVFVCFSAGGTGAGGRARWKYTGAVEAHTCMRAGVPRSSVLVPHCLVEIGIEGRITVDTTCSNIFHSIKEHSRIKKALTQGGVIFEAILPQTRQVSNDKRIFIVGSVLFVVEVRIVGLADGNASGNRTFPPAFIL